MTADPFEWVPRDAEFAEARRALDAHPRRAQALAEARMQLAAEGDPRPPFRTLTIRAAANLAEQADSTTTPENT